LLLADRFFFKCKGTRKTHRYTENYEEKKILSRSFKNNANESHLIDVTEIKNLSFFAKENNDTKR